MRMFRAVVNDTRPLTPGMVRVTLGGDGLGDFLSTGVGDEYLRVFFPHDGETEPVMPRAVGRGWEFGAEAEPARMRTYTVREHRRSAGEVVIDFVVHDGGVAAAWARRAAPGDVVVINTPDGLYDPPADLDWQLLVADATGLPAALRLVDQARVGVRTRVVLEVPSAAHEQPVPERDGVEVTWVHGGNGHGPSRIEEIVRSVDLPAGSGYVWVAGETKVLRAVRRYLRHELGLPATAYKVVGYWTDNAEEWRERFESLGAATRASLLALWESDQDAEEIEDEYVRRLESLGL